MRLTARQLEAARAALGRADVCVMAGPGSGKTAVLVEAYKLLVASGVPPTRILAITFTEKAAREMRTRLAEALDPQRRLELERGWVSTVHGFCLRLLKENALAAGIDPDFRVTGEPEAKLLEAAAMEAALEQLYCERPAALERLLRAVRAPSLASNLIEVHEAMRLAGAAIEDGADPSAPAAESFASLLEAVAEAEREPLRGWSPEQRAAAAGVIEWGARARALASQPASPRHFEALREFECPLGRMKRANPAYSRMKQIKDELHPSALRALLAQYYAPERAAIFELLARFERLHRERKQSGGALDYADLEEQAVRLLEDDPEIRRRVQGQFERVLMDEFQDTNRLQWRLLELIRPAGLYAVGDINQSIYGFRYADPEIFNEHRRRVISSGGAPVELEENWRSRPEILAAAGSLLGGAPGIEGRRLEARRAFAEKPAPAIEILCAQARDSGEALEIEAAMVARRVRELEGTLALGAEGRSGFARFRDFAVLVRNSEVLAALTRAFERHGVPHVVSRGKGFWEAWEVVDLTHLLRVLANPRDELSMAAVLRSPLVEISGEALLRLKQLPEKNLGGALWRLDGSSPGFSSPDLARLLRFRDRLESWRARRDSTSPDRLLLEAIEQSGYPFEPGTRAASNIERLLALAREAHGRLAFAELVEQLGRVRKLNPRDPEAPPEDTVNAVKLMTVHAAKGLEFPVVILAALEKGVDSAIRPVAFRPGADLGVRWHIPGSDEDKGDPYHERVREQIKRHEAEESNRLFYVAMTRAEEHLVFAFSGEDNWAKILIGRLPAGWREADGVREIELGGVRARLWRSSRAPEPVPRAESGPVRAAARVVPRPGPPDEGDAAASITAIQLFARCPRRYFLERYLGWEDQAPGRAERDDGESGPDSGELGLAVHKLLAGAAGAASPEAERLARVFRESPLGRRAARAKIVEREFDFVFALEDLVLTGQIDLWFEEQGELILTDYKSGGGDAGDYALQLQLYALALERLRGRLPDRACVFLLASNAAVEISLAPLFLEAARQTVRDFREAQAKLEFPLREGEHCRRCPFYRGMCPAGRSGVAGVVHAAAVHG